MDLVTMTPRMPRIGETLEARDFFTGYGGKGANQAIAAARLGAEVVMVARIGDDMFGAEMRRNFEENGVDASHVKVVEGCPTGVAAISVDDDGNNCIMIVKGANGRLLPADVENAARSLRGWVDLHDTPDRRSGRFAPVQPGRILGQYTLGRRVTQPGAQGRQQVRIPGLAFMVGPGPVAAPQQLRCAEFSQP